MAGPLRDPAELESEVQDVLRDDRRLKHPEAIAVSADRIGTVVLRGAVASPHERRCAIVDARRVDGVFEVIGELNVHPPFGRQLADDAIRAAALQRLADDTQIHAEHIHVKVSRGRITLTGYVRDDAQRALAAADMADLAAVSDVANRIDVR
jgi:osmotically-inducible protein OsmY